MSRKDGKWPLYSSLNHPLLIDYDPASQGLAEELARLATAQPSIDSKRRMFRMHHAVGESRQCSVSMLFMDNQRGMPCTGAAGNGIHSRAAQLLVT